MPVTPTRVVILDRDGIVNELVAQPPDNDPESPLSPDEVRLLADAPGALELIRGSGFLLACATNQPSAAKGLITVAEVNAIQDKVLDELGQRGIELDAVRMCLHHPRASRPELGGPCRCRKPAPGMLLDVLQQLDAEASTSWMIGDTDADVLAGQAAGLRTILVRNPASRHKRSGQVRPDVAVTTLLEAAAIVRRGD
jgi:D-glycero-D-manno-heptose 1,7-bisphosphate phosphatase